MSKQEESKKKSGCGGRREGAGRPKGRNDVCTITLRIPEDVERILDNVPGSKSAFIIEAIRAYAHAQI